MILGVVSDTHGHRDLMNEVATRLDRDFGVDWIYHAGDDYSDALALDFAGYKVRAVPGTWCPEYASGHVPRRILDDLDGFTIAMAHSEKDLTAQERAACVVVTGHTHTARIECLAGHVYLNPGHLKGRIDRGEAASFAVIQIEEDRVRFSIHELDGAIRDLLEVPREDIA